MGNPPDEDSEVTGLPSKGEEELSISGCLIGGNLVWLRLGPPAVKGDEIELFESVVRPVVSDNVGVIKPNAREVERAMGCS